MVDISHDIKINASRAEVFAALTTKEGMQGWYTAHVSGDGSVGSVWRFEFPGRPTFEWEVTATDPDSSVAWRCVAGPGDSPGTTVEYRLSDAGDGRTLLEHTHSGWPHEEGNFRKCNTLWGVLVHHLQQYAETRTAAPAFT